MIRFVVGPDGTAVPDLAEKLPGRGIWVRADRDALALAVKKNAFARSAKQQVRPPENLIERIEELLVKRVVQQLALCRKAGLAVAGFEKVRDVLENWRGGEPAALLQASDGAEDGRRKIRKLVEETPVITVLKKNELGLAFGRPYVIHAALVAGGAADRAIREALRLEGVRVVSST